MNAAAPAPGHVEQAVARWRDLDEKAIGLREQLLAVAKRLEPLQAEHAPLRLQLEREARYVMGGSFVGDAPLTAATPEGFNLCIRTLEQARDRGMAVRRDLDDLLARERRVRAEVERLKGVRDELQQRATDARSLADSCRRFLEQHGVVVDWRGRRLHRVGGTVSAPGGTGNVGLIGSAT